MSRDLNTVSVVIPTHNRCDALKRTLEGLSNQDFSLEQMEVIVVLDGCQDGTSKMLPDYRAPFRLIPVEQEHAGPAAARNRGAAIATGWLLIFLDDDIAPTPRWLAAHVKIQQRMENQVVIGFYPPVSHGKLDYVGMTIRAWWHDKFRKMQHPAHRFSYQDLLSGNCSMRSDLFARIGGFDATFPSAHEDYELGVRLLKAGATFIFSAEAEASHYVLDTLSVAWMQRRARLEGRADVLIGTRHPAILPLLPLAAYAEPHKRTRRYMNYFAFFRPRLGDALTGLLRLLLRSLQRMQLRRHWQHVYNGLMHYWYLRGLADALGTRDAFVTFMQESAPPGTQENRDVEISIDLGLGVEEAIRLVEQNRPLGARMMFGSQSIGRIAPQPGYEPLRGIHLRAMLATDLVWPLFTAILQQSAFDIGSFPAIGKPPKVATCSD